MSNLITILQALREGKYFSSPYRKFIINDPKTRLILALPYVDRVIHQWLVEEFIKPYYVPRFIRDSYACIPERGTHAAVQRTQYFMRKMQQKYGKYYVVKMDISKFFNSINKDILFQIIAKRVRNRDLLNLIHLVIFDGDDHAGIPIGNYTSQYFANIYLNELDQYAKNELRLKYYVRYMDDFICLVPTKAEAKRVFAALSNFVVERLDMRINRKSRYYPSHFGVDFVGYRIFPDYLLLRRRSKVKIRAIIHDYESGVDDFAKFYCRVQAWLGHAQHADAYRYATKIIAPYRRHFDVHLAQF